MDDKGLVERCKKGDGEALRRIYEKYRSDMLVLAMALLNETSSAEDVVHDVFVSFVHRLAGFRLTGTLKGYLATCVANRARNWNKKKRPRGGIPEAGVCFRSDLPDPTESIICNEQLQLLTGALAQLPYEQREVIMLHMHGRLALRDIAASQGISINTAKSRYRYAIDKLRSILNGEAQNDTRRADRAFD